MNNSITKLQYITRDGGRDLLNDVAAACEGGVRWVQLRLKNLGEEEVTLIAKEVKGICKKYSAVFIINDYVDVAIEVDAHGVHLGKEDMDITEARKLLGDEKIIGASANSFEDILRVSKSDVDYVGLGPFRFTLTKEKLNSVLGENGIREIMAKVKDTAIKIPVIGIGGIQIKDVAMLMSTGVNGIAVSAAINNSKDVIEATRIFIHELEYASKGVMNEIS